MKKKSPHFLFEPFQLSYEVEKWISLQMLEASLSFKINKLNKKINSQRLTKRCFSKSIWFNTINLHYSFHKRVSWTFILNNNIFLISSKIRLLNVAPFRLNKKKKKIIIIIIRKDRVHRTQPTLI